MKNTSETPKPWQFTIHNEAGEQVATLIVHKGSGRWMQRVSNGELLNKSVYAWDATIIYRKPQFGQKPEQSIVVTEKALRAYRKAAKIAEAANA